MPATLKLGQRVPCTLAYFKADGTPGQVQGAPTWESSDTTLVEPAPDADGMTGFWNARGIGAVTVTCRADGDLTPDGADGTGVFPIVLTDTITVEAALGAEGGAMSFGAPESIPA